MNCLNFIKKDTVIYVGDFVPESIAGYFAVKEAIMKSLPNTPNLTFQDIEILNDKFGEPICTTHPNIKLSISHEQEYTIAVAINIQW